jgi:hypothetical protein
MEKRMRMHLVVNPAPFKGQSGKINRICLFN